jgi:hypothetical protein
VNILGDGTMQYPIGMRPLKVFVAKSFDPIDEQKSRQIEDLLDSFGALGLQWESAERAEIESVSQKVRQKIDDCDVFVGIFTRRHPIFSQYPAPAGNQTTDEPTAWTGPPWLFQESGYALRAGKKLMLFRENQVEIPGLQGDLEYIPYDPELPTQAWKKAHEVLAGLVAQGAGIEVHTSVSVASPQETRADETSVEKPVSREATEPSSFQQCICDLIDAEFSRDSSGIERAEEAGLQVIRAGGAQETDELSWKCKCLASRGRMGDTAAFQALQEISAERPTDAAPVWNLASVAESFGEHKTAGDLYSKAADLDPGRVRHRIDASGEYLKAKRLNLAREQLGLRSPTRAWRRGQEP